MSNHSDLYTVVKTYEKNEIYRHDKRVSYVYILLRHVETRHCGEVANKISLLKDLSGRKVKNQGGGRNGRKN